MHTELCQISSIILEAGLIEKTIVKGTSIDVMTTIKSLHITYLMNVMTLNGINFFNIISLEIKHSTDMPAAIVNGADAGAPSFKAVYERGMFNIWNPPTTN